MLHCHHSRCQPLCWLRRSLRCAPSSCGALTALPVRLFAPLRMVVSDYHPALQQLIQVECIQRKVPVEGIRNLGGERNLTDSWPHSARADERPSECFLAEDAGGEQLLCLMTERTSRLTVLRVTGNAKVSTCCDSATASCD